MAYASLMCLKAEADGVLVLSHFKGHSCSAAGGAIKNLGMGALTKKSKQDIHEGSMPELKGECALCKKCLEVCPAGCITYDVHGPVFNYAKCVGCSKCVQNCPQKCLKPRVAEFDALLADGAAAAARKFRKAYYVSVLRRIANVCDCSRGLPASAGPSGGPRIVCPDIGVLMGSDACAIDRASVDLVNRRMGRDLFLELWHKSPLLHVAEAEKLGVGSQEYVLEDA